jgi:hypothetical protein
MKTPGEIFTSDNPAICCAIDDSRDVHFILLPVTPGFCAVAFDKRFLEIIGPMTMEDLSKIQTLLVGTSLDALFSHRRFSGEETDVLIKFRTERKGPTGSIDGTVWIPNFILLKQPFSFFRHI